MGAGGVVPSIILALKKMGADKIILSNRTKKKAEKLKKIFINLEIVNWGEIPEFNMIINATSLGLNKEDEIKLNYDESIFPSEEAISGKRIVEFAKLLLKDEEKYKKQFSKYLKDNQKPELMVEQFEKVKTKINGE